MDEKIIKVLKELEKRKEEELSAGFPPERRLRSIPSETGQFLNILVKAMKAKKILEIGTALGYSTIWLGEAAKKNKGRVFTLECNSESAQLAWENLTKAGLDKVVKIVLGDARVTLNEVNEEFDFVFIDAEKKDYIAYFDKVFPKTRPGGLIVADNIVSHANELIYFKKHIEEFPNVESVTVPIGKGELLIYKVK
jgi:predicted O-methyltransferase YrrM